MSTRARGSSVGRSVDARASSVVLVERARVSVGVDERRAAPMGPSGEVVVEGFGGDCMVSVWVNSHDVRTRVVPKIFMQRQRGRRPPLGERRAVDGQPSGGASRDDVVRGEC